MTAKAASHTPLGPSRGSRRNSEAITPPCFMRIARKMRVLCLLFIALVRRKGPKIRLQMDHFSTEISPNGIPMLLGNLIFNLSNDVVLNAGKFSYHDTSRLSRLKVSARNDIQN